MNQRDVTEPQKAIAAILTRNAAFYHEHPDDEALYYIDPGTILVLAYHIMQYVGTVFGFGLPIISGARWAHAYLKKRRAGAGGGADATTPDVPDQYLTEQAPAVVSERLDALRGKLQDSKLQEQIRANVQEILEFHGWAAAEANKDADLILSVLTPKAPEVQK
jgi:hypothetical protein